MRASARRRRRDADEDLIPVDPHVGDDAHLDASADRNLPREIDDDRLRPADREADVRDDRPPAARSRPSPGAPAAPCSIRAWSAATLSLENA